MRRVQNRLFCTIHLCFLLCTILQANSSDVKVNCQSLGEVVEGLYIEDQLDDPILKSEFLNLYQKLDISQCESHIDVLNISGYFFYVDNNVFDAKKNLFKADSILKETAFIDKKAQNQLFLGLVYILEKNYDAAILSFKRCKKNAQTQGDQMKVVDAEMNLGLAYLEKNELEKAEEIYLESLEYLKTNEQSLLLGYVYLNLSRIKLKKGQFEQALVYCADAESKWININHVKGLSYTNHLFYEILTALDQIEDGIPHLLNSLDLIEKSDFNIKKAEVFFNLGVAYKGINDTQNSLVYYRKALHRGYELPNQKFLELVQILGDYYFEKGSKSEYQSYQQDLGKVLSRKDEIEVLESEKNLDNEEEIDTLNKQKTAQFRTFGIIGIISLILFWTIFRISEYRKKLLQKIQLQNDSLETMNKKLIKSTTEIQEKNRLYELKNEELKSFAYVASHDLKAPLRTMVSYISLLKLKIKEQLEQNQLQYFKIIEDSGKSMTALINDLLSYSNIEQTNLNLTEIDCKKMLDHVQGVISKDVSKYNAKIDVDIPNPFLIKGDKIKLQQVVQNIIVNAIKHSAPNRDPHIKISSTENETHFIFHFEDNGEGIDPAHINQIFEMFKKFNKKNNADSSGIGLAICKKAIEMHKGEVWVKNNEKVGCTFSFSIHKYL